VLLVRRRGSSTSRERECFLVHSKPARSRIERTSYSDPAELLTLPLEALAAGDPTPVGVAVDGPLFLVCTNTRRDACCGRLGRPVARTLQGALGERLRECTHVGGHRFAANLVCLPRGDVFGRVRPENASRVVSAYGEGRLELDFYRGRVSYPPSVQAADFYVRRETGRVGIEELALAEEIGLENGEVEVTFTADGARFVVRVSPELLAPARPTSCVGGEVVEPRSWSLGELRLDA
jgi:Sucrase/ferredoxin-like